MTTPSTDRTLRTALGLALLVVGLTACATHRDAIEDPVNLYVMAKSVETGQTRLACGMTCYGSWTAARSRAKGLHQQALWVDLASEVTRVGYASDLTYYYLGRAADGLGARAAASTYYRLALASDNRCAGMLFSSCDGIDVPAMARAALASAPPGPASPMAR